MNSFVIKNLTPLILILGMFAVIFFAPITTKGTLQEAQAQGILVYDLQNTLTNTLQTLSTVALEQKEIVWDALFYQIAQQALQQMTGDIISWINSGFDGEPAFVTDLQGYLLNIADEIAGQFIYGDQLSTICTPFQLDVRIALATQYQKKTAGGFKEKAECTLEKYGDVESFLSGNFQAGGWSMWFEAALNPTQTPLGALLEAEAELDKQIAEKQEHKLQQLNWNQGFMSLEVCTPTPNGGEQCKIVTPGIVFKDMLTNALNAPMQSLINADEMNEVIGALFSNLAQQAISGVNGLLGLGGNASFSANSFGANLNLSYLDAMDIEAQQKVTSGGAVGGRIEQALVTETKVLEAQVNTLQALESVNALFEDTKEPFEGDSCWDLSYPTSFTAKANELISGSEKTIAAIIKLQQLAEAYESTSGAQAQLAILNEFTQMQSTGALGGQTALIEHEYYLRNTLAPTIEAFTERIEDEETSC